MRRECRAGSVTEKIFRAAAILSLSSCADALAAVSSQKEQPSKQLTRLFKECEVDLLPGNHFLGHDKLTQLLI